MNTLENYNRENKFVESLNNAFDKHIEIGREKIELILSKINKIDNEKFDLDNKSVEEIYETRDPKLKVKLIDRFTHELRTAHKAYKLILKRFIQEHLTHKEAITFTLKNEILNIKDVMRILEIDYFKSAENDYDNFIFSFRDASIELLDELTIYIRNEYKDYLKNTELDDSNILEIDDDGYDFNSVFSKVVLMNELGIISMLKDKHPHLSTKDLAKILSKITGTPPDNLRRSIGDMKTTEGKNDPYKNPKNLLKVESLLNLYNVTKKGEN